MMRWVVDKEYGCNEDIQVSDRYILFECWSPDKIIMLNWDILLIKKALAFMDYPLDNNYYAGNFEEYLVCLEMDRL